MDVLDRRDLLLAGAALYNAGHYLAAHEPWEAAWLEDDRDDRDDCLQGLIQTTAAVHKFQVGNESGARGLAASAHAYLADCAENWPTIDAIPLREYTARLAEDPAVGTREDPPSLAIDGAVVEPTDLSVPAAVEAVDAIAEATEDEVLERAADYAATDLAAGDETSPIVTLVRDVLVTKDPMARQRLAEHVERRHARETDVDGLFEPDADATDDPA